MQVTHFFTDHFRHKNSTLGTEALTSKPCLGDQASVDAATDKALAMERQARISDARRSCPVGVPRRRPQHILLYKYKQDLQRSSLSWWANALSFSALVKPPTLVPATSETQNRNASTT